MSSITCGNCGLTHVSVESVKACYARITAPITSVRAGILDTRELDSTQPDNRVAARHSRYDGAGRMTDAGQRVSYSRNQQPRESFTKADSGIYKSGERIFKVYSNQTGTAMLAKELIVNHIGGSHWTYQGAAFRFVKKAERITKEQAEVFGKIYGVCAICGRMLTDEQSIAQGIGPVCIKKQGW